MDWQFGVPRSCLAHAQARTHAHQILLEEIHRMVANRFLPLPRFSTKPSCCKLIKEKKCINNSSPQMPHVFTLCSLKITSITRRRIRQPPKYEPSSSTRATSSVDLLVSAQPHTQERDSALVLRLRRNVPPPSTPHFPSRQPHPSASKSVSASRCLAGRQTDNWP